MFRLQSQMTMLTMRCRVLQNELLEGQQEQETAAKKLVLLEHTLQQQKYAEHMAAQRSVHNKTCIAFFGHQLASSELCLWIHPAI